MSELTITVLYPLQSSPFLPLARNQISGVYELPPPSLVLNQLSGHHSSSITSHIHTPDNGLLPRLLPGLRQAVHRGTLLLTGLPLGRPREGSSISASITGQRHGSSKVLVVVCDVAETAGQGCTRHDKLSSRRHHQTTLALFVTDISDLELEYVGIGQRHEPSGSHRASRLLLLIRPNPCCQTTTESAMTTTTSHTLMVNHHSLFVDERSTSTSSHSYF